MYEVGTKIWFTDGDEEMWGNVNGPQVEDYIPVYCFQKENTMFVHISNIVSQEASPSEIRKVFEA